MNNILQKKIIYEKPKGIQRNLQKLIFFLGKKNTKSTKSRKVVPQKIIET